jgi:anti-sigma regulatory factor (Ser/Thr protein kinase)
MARKSRQSPAVREFILRNVARHAGDIGTLTVRQFGLSRTAVAGYMRRLVAEGLLAAEGSTRARRYQPKSLAHVTFTVEIAPGLAEDRVFRTQILPLLAGVGQTVIDICQYGFTEMLANAIAHSGSADALVIFDRSHAAIVMVIVDHGIGVFEKIRRGFDLADPSSALLELAKGRLTTEPAKHTGDGIFYTSRLFDAFGLQSDGLYYTRKRNSDGGWSINAQHMEAPPKGTSVAMTIATDAAWTVADVLGAEPTDDPERRRMHVPVRLARYAGEQLVSRSQAKRVLARADRFAEAVLDFDGVEMIGTAFADEIFRVFAMAHPGTKLVPVNAGPDVRRTIDAIIASGPSRNQVT